MSERWNMDAANMSDESAEMPSAQTVEPDTPVAPARTPSPAQQAPAQSDFVFALGQVEPRFASLAAEKEFAQVTGRADTTGQTDRQVLQSVLTERANRYLVRQLCW